MYPSTKDGMTPDQELYCRQIGASFLQVLGERLRLSQLTINTAIVYMHKFYEQYSFAKFNYQDTSRAAVFLATKQEEQRRNKLDVIKMANTYLKLRISSELLQEQSLDLNLMEELLLLLFNFNTTIEHPHIHIQRTCELIEAPEHLTKIATCFANDSLHLTTMCLQYDPKVVACFCVYIAFQFLRMEIPQSSEGDHWLHQTDANVTLQLLQQLETEYLNIYDKCPLKLRRKMKCFNMRNEKEADHLSNYEATSTTQSTQTTGTQEHHCHTNHQPQQRMPTVNYVRPARSFSCPPQPLLVPVLVNNRPMWIQANQMNQQLFHPMPEFQQMMQYPPNNQMTPANYYCCQEAPPSQQNYQQIMHHNFVPANYQCQEARPPQIHQNSFQDPRQILQGQQNPQSYGRTQFRGSYV